MEEKGPSRPLLWVNPNDRRGEPIDEALIQAAHRIFSRVVYLTGQFLHDEASAPQILEESVHAVWEAIRNKSEGEQIVSLEAYLFRTVVRNLGQRRARESRISYGYALEDLGRMSASRNEDWPSAIVRELEAEELLSYADHRTRELYVHRALGDSWGETAKGMGISSADNARNLFRYGVQKALERILSRKRSSPNSGEV